MGDVVVDRLDVVRNDKMMVMVRGGGREEGITTVLSPVSPHRLAPVGLECTLGSRYSLTEVIVMR